VQLRIDLDQHSGETDGRVAAEWLSKTFFKERLYHEATSAQGHAAWATIALPPLNGRYLPKTTVHEHLNALGEGSQRTPPRTLLQIVKHRGSGGIQHLYTRGCAGSYRASRKTGKVTNCVNDEHVDRLIKSHFQWSVLARIIRAGRPKPLKGLIVKKLPKAFYK